jgi:predicted cation transporter
LVIIGVIASAAFGVFWVRKSAPVASLDAVGPDGAEATTEVTSCPNPEVEKPLSEAGEDEGGLREVIMRTIKVYAFVAALFLLGAGMGVIIDKYVIQLPAAVLYWINMVSAILDNATLTAAEIGPSMDQIQINAALMGLLVSGGMLIPGNIPNIISAGKLGITSSEWAKLGVPFGLVLMVAYFVLVFLLGWSPALGL